MHNHVIRMRDQWNRGTCEEDLEQHLTKTADRLTAFVGEIKNDKKTKANRIRQKNEEEEEEKAKDGEQVLWSRATMRLDRNTGLERSRASFGNIGGRKGDANLARSEVKVAEVNYSTI